MTRDPNLTRTIDLLRRLRDGADPESGRPLPADHLCQRGDVVRALFRAVEALETGRDAPTGAVGRADDAAAPRVAAEPHASEAPSRPPRTRAPNAGRPWTDEDDRDLVEAFDGGADERELGAVFGRSRSSIRARLIRLGRGALLGDGPAPRYPVRVAGAAAATPDVGGEAGDGSSSIDTVEDLDAPGEVGARDDGVTVEVGAPAGAAAE